MFNNKGFTVFELLIGFIFLSMISYFLMTTIFNVREQQQFTIIKGELTNLQVNLTKDINVDFTTNNIEGIINCPDQQNCILINYSNIGSKRLEVNIDDNIITYGDNEYHLVEESYITDFVIKQESYPITDKNRENALFKLIIAIEHIDIPGDYGININYLYNNNEEHVGIINTGLIAWYKFDGNADDYSGNLNHGTVTGATPCPDRFGDANKAYYFNGNSYIEITSRTLWGLSKELTISAWVKFDNVANEEPVGVIIGNYNKKISFNLEGYTNGTLRFWWPSRLDLKGNTDLRGKWHHVVVVCDKNTDKNTLYIDGNLEAEVIGGIQKMDVSFPFKIGDHFYTPGLPFHGAIDDIRIYNRVLTTEEIQFISNWW
ncbi:MAG: LamG domain-containing protein [Bacilli bacterium]